MNHDIEVLIDRAIVDTHAYLGAPGGDRRVARAGLERILADLTARAPGRPALARLGAFIAELARPENADGGAESTARTARSASPWPRCGS
jgi:hypothetical protein